MSQLYTQHFPFRYENKTCLQSASRNVGYQARNRNTLQEYDRQQSELQRPELEIDKYSNRTSYTQIERTITVQPCLICITH